ncbi:hypothetical protein, partial [Streptomyces rhizosphaericus]|uniref:hypothetical protein n=1 Tax=Streptomyces rhizosphaericus TaxID=114699 RepID=UPI0031E0ED1B
RLHVVLEGISRGFSAVKIRNHAHDGAYSPRALHLTGAISIARFSDRRRQLCCDHCPQFLQQTPRPAA